VTTLPNPPPAALRRKFPLFAILFLLIFPLGLLAMVIYQRAQNLHPGALTSPDQRSPFSVDMPTLDGERWKLSDHAGKIVVVNFFATWCGPCRDEFPDLCKIASDYSARGVDIAAVGLNTDADSPLGKLESLKRFVQSERPPFPILLAPDETIRRSEMIPYTYLLDRHGRIAYFMLGRFETAHLRALIDQLLQEP
jgi:thiol-disulfide isomerase/thioredoxin